MRSWILVISCLIASSFWSPISGQSTGSPYTSLGVGALQQQGLVYNQNMAGLGVSINNNWAVNNLNAALLPFNSFFTFEAAVSSESRVVSSDTLSQKNLSGNLDYIIFAFPLKTGKGTVSLGLTPYSNVSYKVETIGPVLGTETKADYRYEGSGGINQFFIATGWKIYKGLYAGIKGSYIFSSINDNAIIEPFDEVDEEDPDPQPPTNYYTSIYLEKTRFSGFIFQPGIAYIMKVAKNTTLNLGATYEISSRVATFRSEILEMRKGAEISIAGDSLSVDERFETKFPARMAFGVSLNKFLKWTVGLDFHYDQWEDYRNFRGDNDGFKNGMKIILGGSITPDIASVTNYLQRITYQAGFYYEKTPIYLKNRQIDDFGINFGVSLPISTASLLTLGVNFGKMGTLNDLLIQENYIKFKLGLSFNDRSFGWYRKQRKFN